MKHNNICYAPVNDCGGYGGNWYWNSPMRPTAAQVALFGGGFNSTLQAYNITNVYNYATDSVTFGTTLINYTTPNNVSPGTPYIPNTVGAGNSQIAIFTGQNTTGNNYIYSSNSVASITNFVLLNNNPASAIGNSYQGLYINSNSINIQTYNYSNFTSAFIGQLNVQASSYNEIAAHTWGNQSQAEIYLQYGETQNTYYYSTNSISITQLPLGYIPLICAAISNSTTAIISVYEYYNGSWTQSQGMTCIINISNNAVIQNNMYVLTFGSPYAAASNPEWGIFVNSSLTNKYFYNSNSVQTGSNLQSINFNVGFGTSSYNSGVNT